MSGLKLGILISGSGSNLQSIIDATKNKTLASQICCVISNKDTAYGLQRAKHYQIPAFFVNPTEEGYDEKVMAILERSQVDLVVLAGYLKIIPETMIKAYKGRVINIHPSLLPKYGGKGYYGIHVHEAVLKNKETETGATVHYVEAGIDTGGIILQGKVPIEEGETKETLQQKVLIEVEHKILVEAIKRFEEEGFI